MLNTFADDMHVRVCT